MAIHKKKKPINRSPTVLNPALHLYNRREKFPFKPFFTDQEFLNAACVRALNYVLCARVDESASDI